MQGNKNLFKEIDRCIVRLLVLMLTVSIAILAIIATLTAIAMSIK